MINKVLIIGSVWPEPKSTAAGERIMQIIALMQAEKWEIIFASAAAESEFAFDLKTINVKTETIALNNASFDDFIKVLNPNIVIFDRFMIEEQFGWRVTENCPTALRILDTIDLHFLRITRFENYKKGFETQPINYLQSDIAIREIAAIYRCDVSLLVSEVEMEILTNTFKIDSKIIYYLPFLMRKITENDLKNKPSFAQRQHFITIGNFRHEPNWNSVLYLKETIFPLIKQQLPDAQMHIYGSYMPPKALQLHNVKQGFIIKGRANNANEVIENARVLLAPLRFGAGIKGKLTDAMQNGTPSVTTQIGAEGMYGNLNWNGFIEDNPNQFANVAVQLYLDENLWNICQRNGLEIINNRFEKTVFSTSFINYILEVQVKIKQHRTENFMGQLLQHHTLRSTKYMSKWIEEKQKNVKNKFQ